jgi:hypothetical protein
MKKERLFCIKATVATKPSGTQLRKFAPQEEQEKTSF